MALVTGASSGIGECVARSLARAGMRVVLVARRAEALHALAAELPEGHTMVVPTDLRDPDSIGALFDRVRGHWGGVDVLVNNAGLGHMAPLLDGDTEQWREMLDVNVLALCICTREAVRDMAARGTEGHVIHINSMSGHRVTDGAGIYGASKYAVTSLTESLRRELHEAELPVRVSAVSPGIVRTGFHAQFFGDAQQALDNYAAFRPLDAQDVADAVLYALGTPAHVAVHDVLLRPRAQRS